MAVNRCHRSLSSCTGSAPLVAVEGDIVTLNWKCFSEEGEVRSGYVCRQLQVVIVVCSNQGDLMLPG